MSSDNNSHSQRTGYAPLTGASDEEGELEEEGEIGELNSSSGNNSGAIGANSTLSLGPGSNNTSSTGRRTSWGPPRGGGGNNNSGSSNNKPPPPPPPPPPPQMGGFHRANSSSSNNGGNNNAISGGTAGASMRRIPPFGGGVGGGNNNNNLPPSLSHMPPNSANNNGGGAGPSPMLAQRAHSTGSSIGTGGSFRPGGGSGHHLHPPLPPFHHHHPPPNHHHRATDPRFRSVGPTPPHLSGDHRRASDSAILGGSGGNSGGSTPSYSSLADLKPPLSMDSNNNNNNTPSNSSMGPLHSNMASGGPIVGGASLMQSSLAADEPPVFLRGARGAGNSNSSLPEMSDMDPRLSGMKNSSGNNNAGNFRGGGLQPPHVRRGSDFRNDNINNNSGPLGPPAFRGGRGNAGRGMGRGGGGPPPVLAPHMQQQPQQQQPQPPLPPHHHHHNSHHHPHHGIPPPPPPHMQQQQQQQPPPHHHHIHHHPHPGGRGGGPNNAGRGGGGAPIGMRSGPGGRGGRGGGPDIGGGGAGSFRGNGGGPDGVGPGGFRGPDGGGFRGGNGPDGPGFRGGNGPDGPAFRGGNGPDGGSAFRSGGPPGGPDGVGGPGGFRPGGTGADGAGPFRSGNGPEVGGPGGFRGGNGPEVGGPGGFRGAGGGPDVPGPGGFRSGAGALDGGGPGSFRGSSGPGSGGDNSEGMSYYGPGAGTDSFRRSSGSSIGLGGGNNNDTPAHPPPMPRGGNASGRFVGRGSLTQSSIGGRPMGPNNNSNSSGGSGGNQGGPHHPHGMRGGPGGTSWNDSRLIPEYAADPGWGMEAMDDRSGPNINNSSNPHHSMMGNSGNVPLRSTSSFAAMADRGPMMDPRPYPGHVSSNNSNAFVPEPSADPFGRNWNSNPSSKRGSPHASPSHPRKTVSLPHGGQQPSDGTVKQPPGADIGNAGGNKGVTRANASSNRETAVAPPATPVEEAKLRTDALGENCGRAEQVIRVLRRVTQGSLQSVDDNVGEDGKNDESDNQPSELPTKTDLFQAMAKLDAKIKECQASLEQGTKEVSAQIEREAEEEEKAKKEAKEKAERLREAQEVWRREREEAEERLREEELKILENDGKELLDGKIEVFRGESKEEIHLELSKEEERHACEINQQVETASKDFDRDLAHARQQLEKYSQAANKTAGRFATLESAHQKAQLAQARQNAGYLTPDPAQVVQQVITENRKRASESHVNCLVFASEHDAPEVNLYLGLEERRDPKENRTSAEWFQMTKQVTGLADALYSEPTEAPYFAYNEETHGAYEPLITEYVRHERKILNGHWRELAEEYEYRREVFKKKFKKRAASRRGSSRPAITTLVPRQPLFPMLEVDGKKVAPSAKGSSNENNNSTQQRGGHNASTSGSSNPYRRLRRNNEVLTEYEQEQMIAELAAKEAMEKKKSNLSALPRQVGKVEQRLSVRHERCFAAYRVDPMEEQKRVAVTNVWTDMEKCIFLDRFMHHPKDFRKIASFLRNKSTVDCVAFYYNSKQVVPYKGALKEFIMRRKRRGEYHIWDATIQAALAVGAVIKRGPNEEKPLVFLLPSRDDTYATTRLHPMRLELFEDMIIDEKRGLRLLESGNYGKKGGTHEFRKRPPVPLFLLDSREKKHLKVELYEKPAPEPPLPEPEPEPQPPQQQLPRPVAEEPVEVEDSKMSATSIPSTVLPNNTATAAHLRKVPQKWTAAEKRVFLETLEKHGKDWELLSRAVGTKSTAQIKNYYYDYKKQLERGKKEKKMSKTERIRRREERATTPTPTEVCPAHGSETTKDDANVNASGLLMSPEPGKQIVAKAEMEEPGEEEPHAEEPVTQEPLVEEPVLSQPILPEPPAAPEPALQEEPQTVSQHESYQEPQSAGQANAFSHQDFIAQAQKAMLENQIQQHQQQQRQLSEEVARLIQQQQHQQQHQQQQQQQHKPPPQPRQQQMLSNFLPWMVSNPALQRDRFQPAHAAPDIDQHQQLQALLQLQQLQQQQQQQQQQLQQQQQHQQQLQSLNLSGMVNPAAALGFLERQQQQARQQQQQLADEAQLTTTMQLLANGGGAGLGEGTAASSLALLVRALQQRQNERAGQGDG